jgi:hypothetical protein
MIWALDIDGVITANPTFFSWLTYHLSKRGNKNIICIITSRNPSRLAETEEYLKSQNIYYDKLISMKPEHPRGHKELLMWKLGHLIAIQPDIWMDDSIKLYSQLYGIDLKQHLPNCNLVQI